MSSEIEPAHEHDKGHVVEYTTYIGVWLALIMLTALTVAVAGLNLAKLTIVVAIVVATIKTSLVLWQFMHLKFDNMVMRIFFAFVVVTFLVFLGLFFVDIATRQ